MNRSMAVWCVARGSDPATAMEAHFNYWRLTGDEEFRRTANGAVADLLEIGIMLDDPRAVDRVCIYVPEVVSRGAIADCSEYLRKPDIAQGIFNERLAATVAPRPGPRCFELKVDAAVFCRVYPFIFDGGEITEAELLVTPEARGTLLTITRQAVDEAAFPSSAAPVRTYFRLRIRLGPVGSSPFVRTVPTPDRLLQSGFDEIEYIDFRLNEARTLPEQVEVRMRNEGAGRGVKLRLVAFLTAVPVRSELSASTTTARKLRLLEHQLWNPYVPSGIPDGMMVYHWKREWDPEKRDGITDFSAFVKLQTRRSGRRTLITYLAVAFAFGVLGNCAASGLEAALPATWQMIKALLPGAPTPPAAPAPVAPTTARAPAPTTARTQSRPAQSADSSVGVARNGPGGP